MPMRRYLLLLLMGFIGLSLFAQNNSFLQVESFEKNGMGVFVLPEGMKKTDNNGKPWAMIEIVAKGFDDKLLGEISTFTSSTLVVGKAGYKSETGIYNMIVSSGVKGKITIKYKGTLLEYQLMSPLEKHKVYRLTLLMRKANLTIMAAPPESRIYVDGEEVGSNGLASMELSMGEHTYTVECEDYLAEKDKTIRLEKDEQIEVNLTPLFGYISINTQPSGADVIINGVKVGTTPYMMKRINRGKNDIALQLNGYFEHGEIVDIIAGETKTMNVPLLSFDDVVFDTTNFIVAEITLRFSKDEVVLPSSHSTDSVFVTSNNKNWNFMDTPSWISMFKSNNLLYITCLENLAHEPREADVVVYSGDVTKNLHILQGAGEAVLRSEASDIVFESSADSVTRRVETNVINWTITTSEDWIRAYEKDDNLVVICDANPLPVSRYGSVRVHAFDKDVTFAVSQKAHSTNININKYGINVKAKGGTVRVPTGIEGEEWSCESDLEWLQVSRDDSYVVVELPENLYEERRGSFLLETATKTYRIDVTQEGSYRDKQMVVIDTKPTWSPIYVDGKRLGRSPVKVSIDDSVHVVGHGAEDRFCLLNKQNSNILFNTGLRFIAVTLSSETVGVSSGFIGGKRWGGYNHFQINIDNWDFKPESEKGPLYVMTLGPTFEIMPWMAAYAGVGLAVSNDTLRHMHFDGEDPFDIHRPTPKEITFGLEVEAGLMFYYRHLFATVGFQLNRIGSDKQKFDYTVGLGAYFNRYYDAKRGYCATRSRERWSLNYVFNPVRGGHGIMFSDVGHHNLRWYFKTMVESVDYWYKDEETPGAEPEKKNEIAPGQTLGFVFNLMPVYIDFMIGGGYQGSFKNSSFEPKGAEAEVGFVMNIWRIPLTVMMRCCEVEKDSRYLTVDFGVGFSFGNYLLKNRRK